MQSSYIVIIFSAKGINTIFRLAKDRSLIDNLRKKIYNEIETQEMIEDFHLLVKKHSKNIPVILACTALSILNPDIQKRHCLDMAQEQITAAVRYAIE